MKKISLFLAAALASAVFSATTMTAKSIDACSTGDTTRAVQPTLPVPKNIVHFDNLSRRYENTTVTVTMTIDKAGLPHDVKPAGQVPRDLAAAVVAMVSKWTFTPSYLNGQPVSARVVLPLQLVEG